MFLLPGGPTSRKGSPTPAWEALTKSSTPLQELTVSLGRCRFQELMTPLLCRSKDLLVLSSSLAAAYSPARSLARCDATEESP